MNVEKGKTTLGGYMREYLLFNDGRLYDIQSSKLLKPCKDKDGYLFHNLKDTNGIIRMVKVHRLLALNWVSGHFEGAVVNHKDGDKQNNSLDNLEWVTRSQNAKHSIHVLKNPKPPSPEGKLGKDAHHYKKIRATSAETGEVLVFYGQREAARFLGVKGTNGILSRLKNGGTYRGYSWEYMGENNE